MQTNTIGAAEDYFILPFPKVTWKNRTLPRESESEPKVANSNRQSAKARRTFRATKSNLSSPTFEVADIDVDYLNALTALTELDEVRGAVRSFAELAAGWDGPDSNQALPGVIDDALEVLQNWPTALDTPEPVMAFDGSVALELYDDEGFSKGGVEFKGSHRAVYTVISKTEILSCGTFDAGSLSEIIKSIHCIKNALSVEG